MNHDTHIITTAPGADIRHDQEFPVLTAIAAGGTDAEIVAVDVAGRWQYVRVGQDIYRRDKWTFTPGRWVTRASRWPQTAELYLA